MPSMIVLSVLTGRGLPPEGDILSIQDALARIILENGVNTVIHLATLLSGTAHLRPMRAHLQVCVVGQL